MDSMFWESMILMGPSAASLQRLVTSAPEKPGVDNRSYQQIINEFCSVKFVQMHVIQTFNCSQINWIYERIINRFKSYIVFA